MVRSYGMTLEDLEESLSDILPPGFEIKVVKNKVIIHTNLIENDHGELIQPDDLPLDEDEEEDELEEGYLDDEDSDD